MLRMIYQCLLGKSNNLSAFWMNNCPLREFTQMCNISITRSSLKRFTTGFNFLLCLPYVQHPSSSIIHQEIILHKHLKDDYNVSVVATLRHTEDATEVKIRRSK